MTPRTLAAALCFALAGCRDSAPSPSTTPSAAPAQPAAAVKLAGVALQRATSAAAPPPRTKDVVSRANRADADASNNAKDGAGARPVSSEAPGPAPVAPPLTWAAVLYRADIALKNHGYSEPAETARELAGMTARFRHRAEAAVRNYRQPGEVDRHIAAPLRCIEMTESGLRALPAVIAARAGKAMPFATEYAKRRFEAKPPESAEQAADNVVNIWQGFGVLSRIEAEFVYEALLDKLYGKPIRDVPRNTEAVFHRLAR